MTIPWFDQIKPIRETFTLDELRSLMGKVTADTSQPKCKSCGETAEWLCATDGKTFSPYCDTHIPEDCAKMEWKEDSGK